MFLCCPLQCKLRYIDRLKIPPPSAITLGKSIHGTLEDKYRQKIESQRGLSLEQMPDLFSDRWEREVKEPETVFEEGEKPGAVKDEGIRLVKAYHRIVSPKIQPAYVEEPFSLTFKDIV